MILGVLLLAAPSLEAEVLPECLCEDLPGGGPGGEDLGRPSRAGTRIAPGP
jgi:hypothetical protein